MFLSNELTGIPVNHLVISPDYPDGAPLKQNALNVSFLTMRFDPLINELQVSLDLLHEDGYVAITWLEQIQDLLSKRYFTPQQNWTIPTSPVNVDGNLFWDSDSIVFRKIPISFYSHHNATFFLKFYKTLN